MQQALRRSAMLALTLANPLIFAQTSELTFKPYGFLKSSYIGASQKVLSYGSTGIGGITHAAKIDETNLATKKADTQPRFGFQAQQSRFGFKITHGKNINGQLEFDFVDFGAIAPSPDQDIRLRIAMIEIKFDENLILQTGQKWVAVNGVMPHTYNFIQSNFNSGNTGFISQEMALILKQESLTYTAAISSKGRSQGNLGVKETERGYLPAYTFRLDYDHGHGLVGAAYMGAQLVGESDPANTAGTYKNGEASIQKVFTTFKTASFDLRAEAFLGKNASNLFMLSSDSDTFTPSNGKNIETQGGFLSVKSPLTEKYSVYGGYGFVSTKDGEKKLASDKAVGNKVSTLGLDYKAEGDWLTFLEFQNFNTEYHIGSQIKKSYVATTVETGFVYKF